MYTNHRAVCAEPRKDTGRVTISVRVYRLTSHELQLTEQTGRRSTRVAAAANGAYTTLRTYDTDRIIGLSAHLQRLIESSQLCRAPTRSISLHSIGLARRHRARTIDSAAPAHHRTAGCRSDLISVEPFEVYPAEFYQRGVRCATTRLSRHTPQAKSTDFIAPSRESKAAIDPTIHELLIVNPAGEILEGISSNFYAVIDGVLRLREGCAGRHHTAYRITSSGLGIPIDYRPLTVSEIDRVAEAFITSSSREVMPVIQIDDQIIGSGQQGSITQTLLAKYRSY